MIKSELQCLRKILHESRNLPSYQRDLIDEAISHSEDGSRYLAEQAMERMIRNYKDDGNSEALREVEKFYDY